MIRKMCSTIATVHPSPSSSSYSIGDVRLEEPSTPGTHGEHSKDTKMSNNFKVKRSASEPELHCLFPQKETNANAKRRSSHNPKHYFGLTSSYSSSSSESSIETSISSPSLDLDSSSSSSISPPSTRNAQRRRSSVQFGSLTIRSYEVQLGDNPSCSNGAPVSIGWRYNELNPIGIDAYEEWMKDKRRSRSQFHLPRFERESILREHGYSRDQMKKATKEVAKIKKQRRASLKTTTMSRLQERSLVNMKLMRRSSC